MDATLSEWLDLVIRWAHMITGIAWIGASFYFNWLLNHLTSPKDPDDRVQGELWAIHAGGFFKVEKRKIAPGQLPQTLHWFKWEAYWTWITGFALLVLIYYAQASIYLIDPGVADISVATAIAIGLGTLIVSWFAYDLMWRSPLAKSGWLALGISTLFVVAVAYGLSQVFSGRGAYIHVGAMLGTWMVGNVFRVIMPAQRDLVAASEQGREQDSRLTEFAEQRSLHNNYMTLPVLFIMISNHFPSTYGHDFNWAVLAVLFLVGAMVRYYFNVRHKSQGKLAVWTLPAAGAAILALAYVTAPPSSDRGDAGPSVAFAEVQTLVLQHCVSCHSATPTDESFDVAPKNVMFDTPVQIKAMAQKIKATAVTTDTMPLGNMTEMTDEERILLGQWIDQGATIDQGTMSE